MLRLIRRSAEWAATLLLLATSALGESTESAPPSVRVVVTLVSAQEGALAGEGFVVFRGAVSTSPVVLPTKLPEGAAAELPPGSQWTLLADFPGYFAEATVLRVPEEATKTPIEVRVELHPAGVLTGKFTVQDRQALPEGLEARFEPARDGSRKRPGLPAGRATCAVGKDGEWRCGVPAGRFDVALHPRGFVPHYLWNVAIGAGETSSLGTRKLVRGASISGWVTREDGAPAETCRVRLEQASAPGRPNDPVLEFLRSVASETSCQKKGFFQFSGVAPGSYALVAQDGEAQAQMSPVEVWPGAESKLTTPIELLRPVVFELAISPPLDWVGRPWRVEARRAIEYRNGWEEPSFRTEASPEGKVRLPGRPPGRFRISVYDGLGNTIFSNSHVSLTDPTQPYPIDLDLLWIEGRVRLGDEPVAGKLVFGARSGAASISMNADEDGRFEGPLPESGQWRVDIQATEPRLKASAKVEVKPKDGRASVEIDLPDTKVYGRVVDPSGAPAPGSMVALSSTISTLETQADEKGEFEIRAFPEGTLEIFAEGTGDGREASDAYMFQAAEGVPHGPVTLALRRNEVLRGKVLGTTGPVVGASVSVWPTEGGDGSVSVARSGVDGAFEVKVPESTQRLRVVLSPPSGALKSFDVNVSPEAELLLQVETEGGDLSVDVGEDTSLDNRILAVWQGDVGIPLGLLIRWAEGHGVRFWQEGRVRIPQLAPGSYTVCLGEVAVVDPREIEEWKKARATCASGYLGPAAVLDLRLR